MSKQLNNFPCVCAHDKKDHIWGYSMWCIECAKPKYYPNGVPSNLLPIHHNYKSDNLRYLENLVE